LGNKYGVPGFPNTPLSPRRERGQGEGDKTEKRFLTTETRRHREIFPLNKGGVRGLSKGGSVAPVDIGVFKV